MQDASAATSAREPGERQGARRGEPTTARRRRPGGIGPARAAPIASRRSAGGSQSTARRSRNQGAGGDSVRVVLADDSVLLREGLARLLTEAGFEVIGSGRRRRRAPAGRRGRPRRRGDRGHPHAADAHRRGPPRREPPRAGTPARRARALAVRRRPSYAMELLAESAGGSATCSRTASRIRRSWPTRSAGSATGAPCWIPTWSLNSWGANGTAPICSKT